MPTQVTNQQIAELLARRAEETDGPRQRAYRRSSAAAFIWPEEAADLHSEGRSLTELHYVGDRLAARIAGWIEDPPELVEAPPERDGFITLTQARAALEGAPEWRTEIRGDLQMHTVYSDGVSTVAEMTEAAAERGHEYVAITDHSLGQRVPKGVGEEDLARQAKEIQAVNDAGGIRALRSIEMNLTPDGEGAIPVDELGRFELVVGSFHSQLRAEEPQTDRYVNAVRRSGLDIMGHPRGRMFSRRGGLWAEWDDVFDAALEVNAAFEINANPARQDLQIKLLQVAKEKGLLLSIGTDSHSIAELDFLVFSLGAAIIAGVDRERVINYRSVDDLLEWRSGRSA
jgi:histidinol phosphatase-like PHP family hydrolase